MESSAAETTGFGGMCHVPLGAGERPLNKEPLKVLHGFLFPLFIGQIFPRNLSPRPFRIVQAEVVGTDFFSPAEDERSLDAIFQLTHVAGP